MPPRIPRVARFAVLCALFAASFGPGAGEAQAQTTRARPPAGSVPVDDRRWQDLADRTDNTLAKGDFRAAEQFGRQLVEEGLRVFGNAHANTAASYSLLASALFRQGCYTEAESQFRRALEIYERRSGPDSVNVASALNNLALVLERIGDFAGAEVLLRRSHRILEKALGPNHPDTATTLSNLGRVLDSQGILGTDVWSQRAGASGEDAQQLVAQAEALVARGQYREAETVHHRVLAIHERALGAEHPTTATSLSNLGNVLYLQGKFADAERVHRRALAIREKVLGPGHPDTATSLNNLANVRMEQGKDEQMSLAEQRSRASAGQVVRSGTEIENMYRRALSIQEASLGPNHPALATTLNNLGALLDQRGNYTESEPLQRRALDILEKGLGPLHPDTASTLTTLAVSLDRQGKLVEAEQTYRRAVETSRRAGNPRTLLLNSSRLGYVLAKRGRYREALPFYREAIETLDLLYVRTRGLSEETRAAFLGQYGNIYLETIKLLLQLYRQDSKGGYDRQILEVASRNQSRVFTELMRQADVAKFSTEPAFLELRGRRDALQGRIDALRQALVTIPPDQPNADARRTDLSSQLSGASAELVRVEDGLWTTYPRFMELTNPRPVTVDDLQGRLLRDGEALLSYVLLPQETVVFAVTRDRLRMVTLPVKREDISRRVYVVRHAIDKVASGESVLFLRQVEPIVLNSLYRDLVAPVADLLAGRAKVIVVGDGPLHTIPFELFVGRYGAAEQRAFRLARDKSDGSTEHPFLIEYAQLEYLGKTQRFAYLPSLSAFASQRLYPKQQAEVVRAKDTYRKMRAQTSADDINPELYLYSVLQDYLMYEDMKPVVDEMVKRQPANADVQALAEYAKTRAEYIENIRGR
jgi:tetratricopeptide (TPR) repeat protein